MKNKGFVALFAVALSVALSAPAQEKQAYKDTSLPAEARAIDLVKRMTLDEKASQLVNQARAIPRLGVPAYDWWSESLHGVARDGTTEFPEPVGLGATFDVKAIHNMAEVISTEGRIKYVKALKANGGETKIFEGLDFWAPNINIFRDPRWGRGQETYGEDPYLTARMGVSFVKGMQGDDPRYYKTIATPKHFAVHSGPESTRHTADVPISKHDEVDTYLPAFRAAIIEGQAGSIMCAYNDVNGEPACANSFLLEDQLRNKWKFSGYVVSDCGAVVDIFRNHHFRPDQAQSSGISLARGMDNECADFTFKIKDDSDYKAYKDAVNSGYIKESQIDTALVRLFTARFKLGMFDPAEDVPWTKIDESLLDSAAHRDSARRVANESMVLLKNDGTLPLKKSADLKIAVIGPLAEQTKVELGNYNGTPTHTVSILEGIKKEFAGARIEYVAGTQFLNKDAVEVPASALAAVEESFAKADLSDVNNLGAAKAIVTRKTSRIDAAESALPAEVKDVPALMIRWDGTITASETGDYNLGLRASGFFNIKVDGASVTSAYDAKPDAAKLGRVHLEAGKAAKIHVEYMSNEGAKPEAKLVWKKVDLKPQPEALAAAKKADVVVAVLGISSELEGEEMQVSEPGFKGGDRTSIDLPKPEEDLLEALVGTGKPVVLVMTNGSALAINWAKDHANAILESWYAGEEGGTAVAQTLSGRNNPAGRLPVTFYTGVDQLPAFEDYAMKGRTYRYFDGKPLFPFGYGLSYTSFGYSDLKAPKLPVEAGQPVAIEATVTNTGKVAGDEVPQLYLNFPAVEGAPKIALRGFDRIHLEPGQSQTVRFVLEARDLSVVTPAGDPIIAAGNYTVSVGGGQPNSGAATVAGSFAIKGEVKLAE